MAYLDIPISCNRRRLSSWKVVLDKMQTTLYG